MRVSNAHHDKIIALVAGAKMSNLLLCIDNPHRNKFDDHMVLRFTTMVMFLGWISTIELYA
jgi:hypothetical protein